MPRLTPLAKGCGTLGCGERASKRGAGRGAWPCRRGRRARTATRCSVARQNAGSADRFCKGRRRARPRLVATVVIGAPSGCIARPPGVCTPATRSLHPGDGRLGQNPGDLEVEKMQGTALTCAYARRSPDRRWHLSVRRHLRSSPRLLAGRAHPHADRRRRAPPQRAVRPDTCAKRAVATPSMREVRRCAHPFKF